MTQEEDGLAKLRKQQWKETGRDEIKQNTKFDMARSLFGSGNGGGNVEDRVTQLQNNRKNDSDNNNNHNNNNR